MDFALIGHIESWSHAAALMALLRGAEAMPIPADELREIVPWIPARTVSRISVQSLTGEEANGVYIDSFIPPDRLSERFLRQNLGRIRNAADCAIREGARIAALGGFSSILLEGKVELLPQGSQTVFTTGNTLTVGLILRGMERALALAGRDLHDAKVLIVGATGDVGSGCARCLASQVKCLLLYARNTARLHALADELSDSKAAVEFGTDMKEFRQQPNMVICAASLPSSSLYFETLGPDAIICDAGYPKNLLTGATPLTGVSFFGGLGQVRGSLQLRPDLLLVLNPQPFPNVVHGCLLEGITLALERRFESFSQGRARIFPERVEEMWEMASKHGIALAPLCNASGCVEVKLQSLPRPVAQ